MKGGKRMKKASIFLLVLAIFISSLVSCSSETVKDDNKDPSEVAYIVLSNKSVIFENVGGKKTITYTVGPNTAEDKSVTWYSSNESIATCEDGVISAIGYGVCVIKAISKNGVSASCIVTVENPNPQISITSSELLFSEPKQSAEIRAKDIFGVDITDEVSWISSNTHVATCFNGKVEITGYGICTVSAFAKNGASASCTVIVENPNTPTLKLSKTAIKFDNPGDEADLTAICSNPDSTVTWSSSNPNVAVYEDGKIKALSNGECVLIAVSSEGLTAAASVTVGKRTVATAPSDIMTFEIQNLPCIVKYVDKQTGQVASSVMVTSYEVIFDRGNTSVFVSLVLNCVKIYDRNGPEAKTVIALTTELYSTDVKKPLLTGTYHATGMKVGDHFTVTLNQFGVAQKTNTIREIYMTLCEFTEQ